MRRGAREPEGGEGRDTGTRGWGAKVAERGQSEPRGPMRVRGAKRSQMNYKTSHEIIMKRL